jgi:hypothetical protein
LAKPPPQKTASTPDDFPQVEPQELFPTNNIRFVISETAKLIERVDNLSKATEKLSGSFEKALEKHASDVRERISDVKSDVKESAGKIDALEKGVSFVKGAMWVLGGLFALAIVAVGIVGRMLTG